MKHTLLPLSVLILTAAPTAMAEDAPQPIGDEFCFSIDGIGETLGKFDSLKPEKRDVVGAEIAMQFELEDGELMPERVELREGDQARMVMFDDQGRSVGLSDQLRSMAAPDSVCVMDPPRAERFGKDIGYSVDFGVGVRFKETPGTHSLTEIEEGLKDGRSHYKKMVGAMGFMVPKFTHIAVSGEDETTPPKVFATANGQDIGEPDFELYDGARMIAVDTLEDMGADGVRIEGDTYRMSPSPDAKTVAKFASEDDD
ncbi:hypothetical protein GCM10007853_21680 [Algimonas ampicilliniresistens]|uniref:Uncharacterized protein n=1 Tax=Algimonas ampicilliniresistens TaxID=1298735 RepID=A0ABQ5VBB7_9PROT|nr:hypothetical protein [Algimonas ampicilliniresistens]GLQ24294.1 hypothetical protein GCM10007853_21680 [Algimonas ampicilliniresistens]